MSNGWRVRITGRYANQIRRFWNTHREPVPLKVIRNWCQDEPVDVPWHSPHRLQYPTVYQILTLCRKMGCRVSHPGRKNILVHPPGESS